MSPNLSQRALSLQQYIQITLEHQVSEERRKTQEETGEITGSRQCEELDTLSLSNRRRKLLQIRSPIILYPLEPSRSLFISHHPLRGNARGMAGKVSSSWQRH